MFVISHPLKIIKEPAVFGRYVTLDHVLPVLESYRDICSISFVGSSELGTKIPMVTLGNGGKKVLIWSQMHGNESTTTKAILDFLATVAGNTENSEQIQQFLKSHTLKIIPILNPDGAKAYTRLNVNGVDLNRDAQNRSQKESQALRAVFDAFEPDLCLNLHDQRTIYGLDSGRSSTVAFLSPAADSNRLITPARAVAMKAIARMYKALSTEIPGQVGRYDNGFNLDCVGDTFTSLGVPTILFEAGHFANDYGREITRSLILKALLVVFNISEMNESGTLKHYEAIPENQKSYCDILLKKVRLSQEGTPQNIAIQYVETLADGKILFEPTLLELDSDLSGHKVIDCSGDYIVFNNELTAPLDEKLHFVYNKTKESEISLRI